MRWKPLQVQHYKEDWNPHEASADESRHRQSCWDHVRGGGYRSGSRGAGTSQHGGCNGPGQEAHPGGLMAAAWR